MSYSISNQYKAKCKPVDELILKEAGDNNPVYYTSTYNNTYSTVNTESNRNKYTRRSSNKSVNNIEFDNSCTYKI
jgi:hypothetical protein